MKEYVILFYRPAVDDKAFSSDNYNRSSEPIYLVHCVFDEVNESVYQVRFGDNVLFSSSSREDADKLFFSLYKSFVKPVELP